MATPSLSRVMLDIFKKHGVRRIFGLPSAQLGLVMHEASKDNYFTYMTTRHEEATGHMAHALHCASGEVAVCFGTVGPGVTNMLPGVAAAAADNIPMIVLTPNNQLDLLDPYGDVLQAADQISLYKPITKWRAQLRDAKRAPELIERAVRMAKSGRPGIVQLDIPCDIGSLPCTYDASGEAFVEQRPVPSAAELDKVADLLANAKRPLLLAGGGVVRSEGTAAFRKLVEVTGFAVASSVKGKGVVDPDCPSHIGSAGILGGDGLIAACQEADVVMAIGCKFSTWIPINKLPTYPLVPGQKIIHIDISSEALGANLPVDVGLVGDARETATLLAERLKGRKLNADAAWLASLRQKRQEYVAKLNAAADAPTTNSGALNSAGVVRFIADLLPDDAIVCVDGGQTMQWALSFVKTKNPHHHVHNPGMGHLGSGLPFALGAKVAKPNQPVVLITGDGAMGCTIQELETAARYGINVLVIVLNDSFWGMYKPFGDFLQNQKMGTKLTTVDFVNVARGFGCEGHRATNLDELKQRVTAGLKANKPTVLDVPVEFAAHPIDPFWVHVILRGVDFSSVAG